MKNRRKEEKTCLLLENDVHPGTCYFYITLDHNELHLMKSGTYKRVNLSYVNEAGMVYLP